MFTRVHEYLLNKLPDKVRLKIQIDSKGCWLWSGELNRNGYGRTWHKGKRHMTHIFVYEFTKGNYNRTMLLDHICCNRRCCNPTHLSLVTAKQNVYRGKVVLFKKRV